MHFTIGQYKQTDLYITCLVVSYLLPDMYILILYGFFYLMYTYTYI